MTTDLVTTTPSDSLRNAAEAMAHDHVSGLPVVEAGRAVGVISASDILSFAADAAGFELERSSRSAVEQIPEGEQWADGTGGPPGYYDEDWGGEALYLGEHLPSTDRPEWNVMEENTVAELMTRSVHSISAGAGIQEAAAAMLDAGVRRLLVVDDGELVGVISSTDVMKAVAERGVGG